MTAAPRRLLGALLLALAAVALTATPATAHASLTASTPGDGEVVAAQPERVTLTFTEEVALSGDSLRVLGPDGEPVHTGEPADLGDGTTVTWGIALRPGLPDGTYTVVWHVVSADSHPVSGAFTFSVGAPSATSVDIGSLGASGQDGLTGALYDAARYAAYGGFALLAGAAAFTLCCWPGAAARRPARRVLRAGWLAATAATAAQLLLRGPYTGSGRLADAFDPGGLADVAGTRTGTALLARLLLLAAAAGFLAVLTGRYARAHAAGAGRAPAGLTWGLALGGGLVAAGTAATWALSEHASTGPQTTVAVPADIVHLLAVAAWLGGLVTLLALLRAEPDGPPVPRAAVRRFGRLALAAVAALAATGLYQSGRQVGTPDALVATSYGRLLLLKAALVAAVLCVAWYSRRHAGRLAGTPAQPEAGQPEPEPEPEPALVPAPGTSPERARQLARQRAAMRAARRRTRRDADPARAGLRRSVAAEVAVAAVVLAVTTALTATPPARTENAQAAGAAAAPQEPGSGSVRYDTGGGPAGQGTARLHLAPGRTGENTLRVTLEDRRGRPAAAEELRAAFTLPAESIGPLRFTEPARTGPGSWEFSGVTLPRPGAWEAALTIRTSDVDQVTVTTTLTLP
ncbi:copper resistance protein CopC [Streptomyces sp. 7-21]|uniref:copper resistance CopC/CopD family protein n=1 Tax=Streptomyces sp. 7-21 TaxID=2802283 RepID=UPI00191F1EE7|nr:copper resistance protein CopC [Streptomyces sp. 7-21]MBL1067964.1 copper resistance protein CopC/CopD [Streptomyces sp. 7-21]